MRWPLRYQLLFPFAGVMLLALAGVSVLSAYLAAQRSASQIQTQLAHIGDTLQEATFPLNDSVLKQMHGLSSAEFVLTDSSGNVLANSKPELAAIAKAPPPSEPAGFPLGPTVELAGERFFYTSVKLHPTARVPGGTLHVLYPEKSWKESQWDAAMPPLAAGTVALALVAAVSVVITRRLSRPILQLKTQVGRLAKGEFQPIPLPKRDDELRELVTSVNSLALQLDEMRQVIQRSERLSLLGQLSGGLAHHLRNCVTGRLAVQLHQRHCHDADRESLAVALRQLILSDEHLQRFLAMGKPQPPQLAELDLRELLKEVESLVVLSCRHRKIDVSFESCAEPILVNADAEQLRQLLLNLVLNGIDAVGSNGWVRCELAALPAQVVRLRVLDSGPGPPPEIAAKLFEPFVTGKPEGIGLGLAVSRQIAEAHGGTLQFVRENETCFEVLLPGKPQAPNTMEPQMNANERRWKQKAETTKT